MGITGLIPFLEKASRRVNVSEFSGCTVAIDSYCWLHKGAFACADKLVRGEDTDIHIRYCLKYVTMLLSKNIKPILVFDGRHLPAKALTEAKRRESRDTSKKRAAELLSLGKIDEARLYMRRSVDITHAMALALIKECRKRNVDCIVAPYEADAQLAYLNIKNIAQLVITEDSDLILFGCTKVLFKMDLDGVGTLVETIKLPLTMKCPIENYSFDKFRQMCILSGCDYLPSLPGIGLAKARQFVTATQDPNFANALRKLPSYFNSSSLVVRDEYRENFVKAEATFKHQYVYDPIERRMVRLTEPDNEDVEQALCVNAGELLDCKVAFQLALGNLDPFTLKVMDDWHPDRNYKSAALKSDSWIDNASHPSIWSRDFAKYLKEQVPWRKKVEKQEPILMHVQSRPTKKVINLVAKYVPETQDDSLTIESLSSMYCVEPTTKKQKIDNTSEITPTFTHNTQNDPNKDEIVKDIIKGKDKSPILKNKERSFKKYLKNGNSSIILQTLSKFPRTTLDDNIVQSKFFNSTSNEKSDLAIPNDIKEDCTKEDNKRRAIIEESPEISSRNPFKIKPPENSNKVPEVDTECSEILDTQLDISQKENNSPVKNGQLSPILEPSPKGKNPFILNLDDCAPTFDNIQSQDFIIENTYPLETLVTPVDTQLSFGESPPTPALVCQRSFTQSQSLSSSQPVKEVKRNQNVSKRWCKVPGLKRTVSLPSNQPTLLGRFGFEKKPVLKR